MSHVATVETEITDLDALEAACKRLGLELRRGQRTYGWWGNLTEQAMNRSGHVVTVKELSPASLLDLFRDREPNFQIPAGLTVEQWAAGECHHAIKMGKHSYEIGLVRNQKGTGYALLGDWDMLDEFNGTIGVGCSHLRDLYALETSKRVMQAKGYRVQEQRSQTGKLQLRCLN